MPEPKDCTHEGIGQPGCPTCDPRCRHEGGPRDWSPECSDCPRVSGATPTTTRNAQLAADQLFAALEGFRAGCTHWHERPIGFACLSCVHAWLSELRVVVTSSGVRPDGSVRIAVQIETPDAQESSR